MANQAPIPSQDAIAQPRNRQKYGDDRKDPNEGLITKPWIDYLANQGTTIGTAPQRVGSAALTAQSASIAATDLSGGGTSAGLYRVSWYLRIEVPGTVSSTLTVTLSWTDEGVSPTFSGAAVTGNTTTTVQSETFLLYTDAVSPVTYATTYGSVGATAMEYKLYVVLEQVEV